MENNSEQSLLSLLNKYVESGLSPIPVDVKTKRPLLKEGWQNHHATLSDVERWVEKKKCKAFGIVCGEPSGGLEILDFDDYHLPGTFEKWKSLLPKNASDILAKLPISCTQRGGFHVLYRTKIIEGNKKLARRPYDTVLDGEPKHVPACGTNCTGGDICKAKPPQTVIETRGRGGQAIEPPSPGYSLIQGDHTDIPIIDDEIRNVFFRVARVLSQIQEKEKAAPEDKPDVSNRLRPGEDLNIRGTWEDILLPHGWSKAGTNGDTTLWTRPGKKEGISATTNHYGTDQLYVFSTNAHPFESEKSYKKFPAYALLKHGGDWKAATKDLGAQGYGDKLSIPEKSASGAREDKKEEEAAFLPAISHAELMAKEFPPIRFTLDPFFEQGTVNMVSAPPNVWKSWKIFLFAGHIAKGTSVLEKFPTQQTKVMIVNEEDSERLIQDRLNILGITDPSLPIFYRVAQGSKLDGATFVDKLIEEAKDKEVGVIMLDSLRSMHLLDENSSKDMQIVMDKLKKIARANITVIFTHHHRKKGMFNKNDDADASRGSSAINAAISGHISLEEIIREGQKILLVRHLKSKVGPKLEPFEIEINTEDNLVSFKYLGEHQAKEQALTEAKARVLTELEERKVWLGRKDFVHLKVGGLTTIKQATNELEKNGKVKVKLRKDAIAAGLPMFNNDGKPNEKLYSVLKDEADELFDSL